MNICPKALTAAVLAAAALTACNSDDDTIGGTVIEDTTLSNVEVRSFKLTANSNIAPNLDSLHFAIDLANARIFNADSLPVGTITGRAVVELELPTVSKAELVFTDKDGESKTVDYLANPTDSIDFTKGNVKLRLVSADGSNMMEYGVKLNVHLTKPDSLMWDAERFAPLPASGALPRASRTVKIGDNLLCLTTDGLITTAATTANPALGDWSMTAATLPSGADIATLTACGETLYIVASGSLYSSADRAASWTPAGASMTYIYGAYADGVVGCLRAADGSYTFTSYPAGITSGVVPADCPVAATSQMLTYTSQWSSKALAMFVGGRCADSSLSGATWAFDGDSWAEISANHIAVAEGIAIVPYQSLSITPQWKQSFTDVLLAIGGTKADGEPNSTIYMSRDRGVHWSPAPACMQPDADAEPLTGASAFTVSTTLRAESAATASRVSAPVTEWECPYIYLFGGTTRGGHLFNGIRRGYLNALTFTPIY